MFLVRPKGILAAGVVAALAFAAPAGAATTFTPNRFDDPLAALESARAATRR